MKYGFWVTVECNNEHFYHDKLPSWAEVARHIREEVRVAGGCQQTDDWRFVLAEHGKVTAGRYTYAKKPA